MDIAFKDSSSANQFQLFSSTFANNIAAEGGAVHGAFYSGQAIHNNSIFVTGCDFSSNEAQIGSAISWWSSTSNWHGSELPSVAPESLRTIIVSNCVFRQNVAFFHGALAVTEVEMDMDVNNTFEDSINSALFLRNSIVRMNDFLKFSRGVAEVGAGIMLLQSRVVANNGTNVVFDRNVAMSIGGAIFSSVSSQ